MKIVSWNVNGLRAVLGRNDLDWAFAASSAGGDVDVLCLQETKLQADQLTEAMRTPPGFSRSFWAHAETRKGYSGTAIFVRDGLDATAFPFPIGDDDHPDFDLEGRITGVDLGDLVVFSVYFPNGGRGGDRLTFKHAWHDRFLEKIQALSKHKRVVVAGDYNVAHTDLDLALPERWNGFSGTLPEERAWFDRLQGAGFKDTFRDIRGDLPKQFTFWETRVDARKDNLGWRIDYVTVSPALQDLVLDAWISPQIMGSDHCPVGVELDLPSAESRLLAQAGWGEMEGDVDVDDEEDEDDEGARWRR